MPSTKRKRASRRTHAASEVHVCPNPSCQKVLSTPQGLTNHFLHYTTCGNIHSSIVAHLANANLEGNEGVGGAVVPSTASVVFAADPCADSDIDDENVLFDFVEDYPENEVMPAIDNTAEGPPAFAALGAHGVFTGVRVLGFRCSRILRKTK